MANNKIVDVDGVDCIVVVIVDHVNFMVVVACVCIVVVIVDHFIVDDCMLWVIICYQMVVTIHQSLNQFWFISCD